MERADFEFQEGVFIGDVEDEPCSPRGTVRVRITKICFSKNHMGSQQMKDRASKKTRVQGNKMLVVLR